MRLQRCCLRLILLTAAPGRWLTAACSTCEEQAKSCRIAGLRRSCEDRGAAGLQQEGRFKFLCKL